MNVLSLFSGIGLHDLGLERAGCRIVAQVECDPWCCEVLTKHWPEVPKFDDVRTVSADTLLSAGVGRIDLVTGGFPCQPHSVAGKRQGVKDDRWLWPEYARIVRELRPSWVLAENVPGIRTTAADLVLAELEAEGYSCWPLVVGADDVGAPHRRKRVWFVAHRDGDGLHRLRRSGLLDGERAARGDDADGRGERVVGDATGSGREAIRNASKKPPDDVDFASARMGDASSEGLATGRRCSGSTSSTLAESSGARWPALPGEPQHAWEAPRLTQPGLGGAVDGRTRRLDSFARRNRLKALGNGNPPQVVEAIGRVILEAHREEAS